MQQRMWWLTGAAIGLAAAAAGVIVALVAGAIAGRGAVLSAMGAAVLPGLVGAATHLPPVAAYLTVHAAVYVVAGIAALAIARLLDRTPAFATAVVFVVIIVELGFLMLTRMTHELGRVDTTTWYVLLVSHAAGDLVLAAGVLVAHPALRQDVVRGYEE